MLQNSYLLAKIGADTAENEQHFAEICQKLATTLRAGAGGSPSSAAAEIGDVASAVYITNSARSQAAQRAADEGLKRFLIRARET